MGHPHSGVPSWIGAASQSRHTSDRKVLPWGRLVDTSTAGVAVVPGAEAVMYTDGRAVFGQRPGDGADAVDPARTISRLTWSVHRHREADSGQADDRVRVAQHGRIELPAPDPSGLDAVPRVPAHQDAHGVALGPQRAPQGGPIRPEAPVSTTLIAAGRRVGSAQPERAFEVAGLEPLLDGDEEAGGVGAVDDAVVVGQRQVDHRADRDRLAEVRRR